MRGRITTCPVAASAFMRQAAEDPLRALFPAPDRNEPFAALHALADEGLGPPAL